VGAWGCGPFENDDALDWVAELGDSDDPGFPERVLRELDELTRIGSREGGAGIAAAEAVAASRGRAYDPLPEQVQEWLGASGARAGTRARDLALRVIDKIENGAGSELRLLWDEQPDDGPSWHEAVAGLRRRLQALARKPGSAPQARRPRVRVRVGDVVELATSAGTFVYIQLIGEMELGGDLIRVMPGFFDVPLDQESLTRLISGGEAAFLSGGFFKSMVTNAGGTARGNYPVPAAFADPQPLRTGLGPSPAPGDWWVTFGGRKLTAQEFARLYPDIDQTMLADRGIPGTDTLLRMIECGWRPWMDHYNVMWMYPKGTKELTRPEEVTRPKRKSPYPATAVPGKFLLDRQP
jgi:Domain of unknown function (DUF4259)